PIGSHSPSNSSPFPPLVDEPATVLPDAPTNPNQPVPAAPPARKEPAPPYLGRYRITALLGKGTFGAVYKAADDELHREVAIKVPRRDRVARAADAESYLREARVVAGLDHPHIVPVLDVGRTEDGLPFVVSKFIDGSDLRKRLKASRLSVRE